jgi:hypothetical protein
MQELGHSTKILLGIIDPGWNKNRVLAEKRFKFLIAFPPHCVTELNQGLLR